MCFPRWLGCRRGLRERGDRRVSPSRRDSRHSGAGEARSDTARSFAGEPRRQRRSGAGSDAVDGATHAWESISRDRYFRTIRGKTASLFVLACQGTGQLCGLSSVQIDALRSYGESLGLAFQVVDDILDFTSTEQELGKPVGSDLRQGTITLPVILLRDGGELDGRFRAAYESSDVDLQVELVQQSSAIAAAYAEAEQLIQEAR